MKHSTEFKSVLLRGEFNFIGNSESNFKGPVRKGFRPIIWFDKVNGEATSCAFVSDVEVYEGENKVVDIVVLNEQQIGQRLVEGMLLNIGSTAHKIGEFKVIKHLGEWTGGKVS